MESIADRDLPPALVLGLSPTGLIAIRSLGRRGVRVFGADLKKWEIGRFSRYCTYLPHLSDVCMRRQGGELSDALARFAEKAGERMALFLTSDDFIELLHPYRQALCRYFMFSTDLSEVTAEILDKKKFYTLCQRHDIELPATFFPRDDAEAGQIAAEIRYPAIIKPAYVHHFSGHLKGKKVVQVQDREELVREYVVLSKVDPELIIQEVIPGPDSLIYVGACYMDERSEPRAIFVGRKLRQYPPRFGSASLAESLWDPQVARLSVEALQKVGFTGLCGTEFKLDPRDGRLKMIEINPRLTLWMGLAEASGVDIAYTCYRHLLGYSTQPQCQTDGVKWTYAIRDVQSALHYRSCGELTLKEWLRSVKGCSTEAILARDDVMVGGFIPLYAASRVLRYIRPGKA